MNPQFLLVSHECFQYKTLVLATWASISWDPPLMADFPYSHYDILAQAVDLHNMLNIMTTVNNSTFYNVTGLLPGTTYELTVVAVSQVSDVIARSQPSNNIQGTTAVIGKTGTHRL